MAVFLLNNRGQLHERVKVGGVSQTINCDQAASISRANSRVSRPAATSLQPVVFCPAHRGEKSLRPKLSALACHGAMAAARGKSGVAALIGPNSHMTRFIMLRV